MAAKIGKKDTWLCRETSSPIFDTIVPPAVTTYSCFRFKLVNYSVIDQSLAEMSPFRSPLFSLHLLMESDDVFAGLVCQKLNES